MPFSSQAVANAFIKLAQEQGRKLTNMQLQKLVFLAQGYSLALRRDQPLFTHDIHAWQWGPVVPVLYKKLQGYGSGFVEEPIQSPDSIEPASPEMEIIRGVWEGFGRFSGHQLSELTHRPGTPWHVTWDREKFAKIPQDLIARYYQETLATAK